MSTFTIWESEVTTDCKCTDENEQPITGDCWGWCLEYAEQDVAFLVEEWLERNAVTDDPDEVTVLITTEAMNWDRVSAHAISTADKLIEKLKINGDYRLRFKLQRDELTIVRYSHDEPTGSLFTVGIIVDERQPE
jgi:hypothetical protein